MSALGLFGLIRYLLESGALLLLGALLLRALLALRPWLPAARSSWLLGLSRGLMLLALVLPFGMQALPREKLLEPRATLRLGDEEARPSAQGRGARLWLLLAPAPLAPASSV